MEHQLPDIQVTLLHQLALTQPLDILPLQASTHQPQVMLLHRELLATHHRPQVIHPLQAIHPLLEATRQLDLAILQQLHQVHQVIQLLLGTHHMEELQRLVLLEPILQAPVDITNPLHTDVED